jgi:pimeloyl-ACP methyl ester carboxylesterase
MKPRVGRIVSGVVLAIALLVPVSALAQTPPPLPCAEGTLPSGAKSLICVPPVGWNQQLVVYAPGYAAPGPVLNFRDLTLGGVNLPALVLSQGYAFATTSYRQNGLAILEGADDIRELVTAFTVTVAPPQRTFMTGGSEGGLVAALLLEQSPGMFSAGLAACSPVGTFRGQVNYIGDFRVLFDYFFPEVIPGTAIDIPFYVVRDWVTKYLPEALAALQANPARALELMRTSGAAFDPSNAVATIGLTAAHLLTYNIVSTTDAAVKLGGNPYGNQFKLYLGSSNDLRLNLRVERFAAAAAAVAEMKKYETTGNLTRRLVTLHTTADDLVPFVHEPLYLAKVFLTGHSGLVPLPVNRYGHCNFNANELLTAFALTVQ